MPRPGSSMFPTLERKEVKRTEVNSKIGVHEAICLQSEKKKR